jgi:hypothetical protein
MSHLKSLQQIINLLEAAKADADMFDLGNQSAGTRLRVKALEAKKGLDDLRKSVQDTKKAREEG